MANRNLEEEFDTLKADIGALRKDIGSLASSLGDAATDEVKTGRRRVRSAAGRATERVGEAFDDATSEASRRGREGMAALEQQIEERPVTTMLVAFGVGVLVGKLLDR